MKDVDEEKPSQPAELGNVEMTDVEMKDTRERAPEPSELTNDVSDLKKKLRKVRSRIHSEREHRRTLEGEHVTLKGRLARVKEHVKTLKGEVGRLEELAKRVLKHREDVKSTLEETPSDEEESDEDSEVDEWSPGLCKGKLLDEGQPQTQADPNPLFLTRENIATFEAVTDTENGPVQFFHDYEGDLPTQMGDWSKDKAQERVEFVNQQIGIIAADHSRWTKQELDKWCAPVICGDIPSIDRCVFVVELNAKLIFRRGEESKEDEEDWRWMTLVPVFFHATNEEYTWRLLNYPGNNIPRRAVKDVDWTLAKRIRGFRQK